MARKSIIFPVNNKGGVGKTSLLVDLMSVLSIDYRVGFIDMDGQGTLYSTLSGDTTFTQNTAVHTSSHIFEAATFAFAQGARRLKIKVNSQSAPVARFPLGMLYDFPERSQDLEKIIQNNMAETGLIGIDLPPIPHAGLILDYSLIPVLDIVRTADLFPLIVLTPEKNTLEIGLNSYLMVEEYLLRKGIDCSTIHPIVVINKVATSPYSHQSISFSMDPHDREKLRKQGIIFDAEANGFGPFFDFRRNFNYENRRFRVQWMPMINGLRGGDFHLLFNKKPELFNFPELLQLANQMRYTTNIKTDEQLVYSNQIRGLASFVKHYSEAARSRNYSVHKSKMPKLDTLTDLVNKIKAGLMDVEQMRAENPDFNELYDLGQIAIRTSRRYSPDSGFYTVSGVLIRANVLPLEVLCRVVAKTELDLGLHYEGLGWIPGDYEAILEKFSSDYKADNRYSNGFLKLTYQPNEKEPYIEINFEEQNNKGRFDTFLGHLDRELSRYQRATSSSRHHRPLTDSQ